MSAGARASPRGVKVSAAARPGRGAPRALRSLSGPPKALSMYSLSAGSSRRSSICEETDPQAPGDTAGRQRRGAGEKEGEGGGG